jgi:head-tail adaptor
MSVRGLYNVKVNIKKITKASDGMGGFTEAKAVLHKNLPCRINWSSGNERVQFDKNTYYRDAKLFCDIVDITEEDVVVYDGIEYEIVNINNVDNLNKFLTIDIKLVKK